MECNDLKDLNKMDFLKTLETFEKVQLLNVNPNSITFTNIVLAYNRCYGFEYPNRYVQKMFNNS